MMKKTITIVCLMFLFGYGSTLGQGQNAQTHEYNWIYVMLSPGWSRQGNTVYCDVETPYGYLGDSGDRIEIGGKSYMRLYEELLERPMFSSNRKSPEIERIKHYLLGMREEDGRVYVNREEYLDYLSHRGEPQSAWNYTAFGTADYLPYHETEDGELILYDFNMNVGDKYRSVEGRDDVSVVAKDDVVLGDGSPHRRLTLSNGLVLIEGVGCINSPGLLVDYLNSSSEYAGCFSFLSYMDDCQNYSITLYESEDFNIVTSVAHRHADHARNNTLFDLQGRRLKEAPQKGIYIEEGRKKVVSGQKK